MLYLCISCTILASMTGNFGRILQCIVYLIIGPLILRDVGIATERSLQDKPALFLSGLLASVFGVTTLALLGLMGRVPISRRDELVYETSLFTCHLVSLVSSIIFMIVPHSAVCYPLRVLLGYELITVSIYGFGYLQQQEEQQLQKKNL